MSYRDGASPVQRWEHIYDKVKPSEIDETLERRSVEGWELVSVLGTQDNDSWFAMCRLFWKRLV